MLIRLLRWLVRRLLGLRYRIRVGGLTDVAGRGTRGILFLPNHPALIDPVILIVELLPHFAPRALADQDQIDRFFIRWAARKIGVRPLPDMRRYGTDVRAQVGALVDECVTILAAGENLLLYPSGHLYRTRREDLRGNSAVESILKRLPDVRVVLVRTRGLWGSRFSMIDGRMPEVGRVLWRGAWAALASLIFFMPRRSVAVELHEPADLPRRAGRATLNGFIESYYNDQAPPAIYVPYTPWERGGRRELPEPDHRGIGGSVADVPAATRKLVIDFLRERTGIAEMRDEQHLARDLGLDSLARAELLVWLGREFGFTPGDVDSIQTVADVLLAARGQSGGTRTIALKPVHPHWFAPRHRARLSLPAGHTIGEVFLRQAARDPRRAVIADQLRGVLTYRDLITAILALRPQIAALPGERVGIMLPASVTATTAYLATLFAGKTPVLVNWTTGTRNLLHALDVAGVQSVLTARALITRVRAQGVDLAELGARFTYLEEIAAKIDRPTKLAAALRARFSWGSLRRVSMTPSAAILFTSGSESLPKVVPLTHTNLLTNLRDAVSVFELFANDALIGFLPPFHSFGLTVALLLPVLAGARAVYHGNPTEGWVLAQLIGAYRATILLGTPTFLAGVVRAAVAGELATLRLAITGAEACPASLYAALAERCPNAVVLEGYGVTECSPVISANRAEAPQPGTIGRVLPSLEHVIVDVERGVPVRPGEPGMLLVRGPTVFEGYLGPDAASPFVEYAGHSWYRTGDLVSAAADGTLTFRGRLKRFVKLGGEMVSLPAIEAVLSERLGEAGADGPRVAVEATPDEAHPEIVLFTTTAIDRAGANQLIRAAGLSGLHNVTRVIRLEQIPVLGTGKVDYRALRGLVAPPDAAPH